jgi:hypothetical protein
MPKTRNDRSLTRREFSAESLTVLFAGVAITITGCGGDDSPSPTAPGGSTGGSGDRSGAISANHGHVATVTSVQLNSGSSVTLNIQGTSDHPHTVTLSATAVTQIRDGQRVSKTSSNDPSAAFSAHLHTVTFN